MSAPHLEGPRLPAPADTAAPVQRRLVVFEGGQPVLRDVPLVTPALVKDVHSASLAELYEEPGDALALELDLPPSEFYGRTLLEVMMIRRARGAARFAEVDPERVDAILDRELGKPKTTSENHNINESYEHALERIRTTEPVAAPIVDAEVVAPPAATPDDAWRELI